MNLHLEIKTIQIVAVILVVVWDLYWKVKASWVAAKKNNRGWFVALLLINSVGILPIAYLKYNQDSNNKE